MRTYDQLQPPRPSNTQLAAAHQREEDEAERRDEIFAETICGKGEFWIEPRFEEEAALFKVLRVAVSLPGASPTVRWAVMEAALRELAFEDATARASEET